MEKQEKLFLWWGLPHTSFLCLLMLLLGLNLLPHPCRQTTMDHQHVFRQAGLSWEVLITVVALFWQTGVPGDLVHLLGFLCITTMWLFNFLLVKKKPLSRSCRGRRQVAKGTKGNLTTTRLRCIFSSFLLFPSISSWSSSSSFFSVPSCTFHSSFRRFWMPPGPPSSPAGPIGQALGCLHRGLASSSTRFKNNDRLEIINKNSDRYHKTLISYLCHLDRT